jgi:hypothetical protein
MGTLRLRLLRLLSIEHFDGAAVSTFGHLLERREPIAGEHPLELGPSVFDKLAKLVHLFCGDQRF